MNKLEKKSNKDEAKSLNLTKKKTKMYENKNQVHTYIHNWPLQPFSQDYGLASQPTHVVFVNFVREWRDLQFNVDFERQIFEKLFHGRFIYSQSFCQKSAERKSPKKYFSYFVLMA